MKTLYFKCTLLSDIVLNMTAATEGNQKSLDFIPGNKFLGIVASTLYKNLKAEDALTLFHSKSVRFGDAHPICIRQDNIMLSLRIPASYYKSKLGNDSNFYIYHEVENKDEEAYIDFQPKQCRNGFYIFENETLTEIPVNKSFAIKSAYDGETRCSKDNKMYGYESLNKGSTFIFDITIEEESYEKDITLSLSGEKKIGRSRTSEYGLVEIEKIETPVIEVDVLENNPNYALVYADARLIFFDDLGYPTFQPTAKDLGFENGEIDWTKTQIRVFQYAPWNSKRQARDNERCGIEKGSVFYVRKKKDNTELIYPCNKFVGKYQNEGFGKIIINPAFLQAFPNSNGKSLFSLRQEDNTSINTNFPDVNDLLFDFLKSKQEENTKVQQIYKIVNEFIADKNTQDIFTLKTFASQWGNIRSIALKANDKNDLKKRLFDTNNGYLMNGIAKDKWNEKGRLTKFKVFFDKTFDELTFSDKDFCSTIINLSAEMAKLKGGK